MADIVSPKNVSFTFGQGAELVQALIRAGLTPEAAQRIIEEQALAAAVVHLAEREARTTELSLAQDIMGDFFVGIEAYSKLMGVYLDGEMVDRYVGIPFTQAELITAVRNEMYLVAMPELQLLEISERAFERIWYTKACSFEVLVNLDARPGYHLIGEKPRSTSLTWSEQIANLPHTFDVPRVTEVAYLGAACRAMGKVAPFKDWVRTCDREPMGNHIIVKINGTCVSVDYGNYDSQSRRDVGLAAGIYRPLVGS